MNLRQALSVLSKSSPYAVSTASDLEGSEFDELKKCLYVHTDIEAAFIKKLENVQSDEVIFLCGSSGDGKSEILTKYQKLYGKSVEFHLDATHSFEPSLTAIDTLNDVFSAHATSNKALVIGINIGMLGNYEREGSEEHQNIKSAIQAFLSHEPIGNLYTFLDFESFPKFTIVDGRVSSPFFSKLLDNVVKDESSNKFRDYFLNSKSEKTDPVLVSNYLFLRNRYVQKVIVDLLLDARIRKDQFVTARMLLDFIHSILTGPKYIFDNIFDGGDNELLEVIKNFDPSVIRNRKLDAFVLHRTLEFPDPAYQVFMTELQEKFLAPQSLSPQSAVRLIYLLKHCTLENNYHRNFEGSFNERPLLKYKEIWEVHRSYSGASSEKKWLREFYNEIVLKAINKYANRNAPYLSKDQFYLSSHGSCDLSAEIELSIVYKSIQADKSEDLAAFNMYLEVDGEMLDPIPLGVNMLTLMMSIVNGYRPNKYDKNSVVMLDELVAKITETASSSDVLYLYNPGNRFKMKASSGNEIRVSEQ